MTAFILLASLLQPLTEPTFRTEPFIAARVNIVGDGFHGNDVTGPMVVFNCHDGFDLGRGDPYRATGGRIERIKIVKQGTGGTAIALRATSKAERPGEYVIRDVKILGYSDLRGTPTIDNWETGLLIDGGNLNETNAAGIRCVRIDGLRVAGCIGESVVLRNVTHVTATGLQVDPGSVKRVPVVIVENSRHVFIYGLNVFGEVHLRGCENVILSGYAQVIRIDRKCVGVTIEGRVPKVQVERGAGLVTHNGKEFR